MYNYRVVYVWNWVENWLWTVCILLTFGVDFRLDLMWC